MNSDTTRHFGLLIAYILPGFTLLWGISYLSDTVQTWLSGAASPTVGGVVYTTAASITLGMILNAFRWLLVDSLHHATGLRRPAWDDRLLESRLNAFTRLVQDHFQFHQFYANTALALLVTYPMWRLHGGGGSVFTDAFLIVLEGVLILSSRDALSRYYRRTSLLLGDEQRRETMTNGSHPKPQNPKPAPKEKEVVAKAGSDKPVNPKQKG